jgi:hypothetical protein
MNAKGRVNNLVSNESANRRTFPVIFADGSRVSMETTRFFAFAPATGLFLKEEARLSLDQENNQTRRLSALSAAQ